MVRLTSLLSRVPVIKFKKGGASTSSAPAASAASRPPSCPAPSRPTAGAPAAGMSTRATIPDLDLPARYRRQPLSEEEISHINGGGVA